MLAEANFPDPSRRNAKPVSGSTCIRLTAPLGERVAVPLSSAEYGQSSSKVDS